MVATYDETHITGKLTASEIAEAVRHKKYGVDVREAIAQGFEALESREEEVIRISKLEQRVEKLEEENSELQKIKGLKEQLDRLNDAVFGTGSKPIDYSEITKRDEKNEAKELKLPDYIETVKEDKRHKAKGVELD